MARGKRSWLTTVSYQLTAYCGRWAKKTAEERETSADSASWQPIACPRVPFVALFAPVTAVAVPHSFPRYLKELDEPRDVTCHAHMRRTRSTVRR